MKAPSAQQEHLQGVQMAEAHPTGWFARMMRRIAAIDALNFWLTNRIPRIFLTHLIGRFSRVESVGLTRISIAVWKLFSDLDLSESPPKTYRSLREVFTRPLLQGKRRIDTRPSVWVSPCDALMGARGRVYSGLVLQAKGAPYVLSELLGHAETAKRCEGGQYLTLRLTSAMYHRFHAPTDMHIHRVDYISGDVFNVNPPALQRIPSLFCRNERAVIHCTSEHGEPFWIVAVAAVLVASIQLHCLPQRLSLALPGNCTFACDQSVKKGDELGWFEQGSTLIMLMPCDFKLIPGVSHDAFSPVRLCMGSALFERKHTPIVSSV